MVIPADSAMHLVRCLRNRYVVKARSPTTSGLARLMVKDRGQDGDDADADAKWHDHDRKALTDRPLGDEPEERDSRDCSNQHYSVKRPPTRGSHTAGYRAVSSHDVTRAVVIGGGEPT